jgi:hypothetical protein
MKIKELIEELFKIFQEKDEYRLAGMLAFALYRAITNERPSMKVNSDIDGVVAKLHAIVRGDLETCLVLATMNQYLFLRMFEILRAYRDAVAVAYNEAEAGSENEKELRAEFDEVSHEMFSTMSFRERFLLEDEDCTQHVARLGANQAKTNGLLMYSHDTSERSTLD